MFSLVELCGLCRMPLYNGSATMFYGDPNSPSVGHVSCIVERWLPKLDDDDGATGANRREK